MKKKIFELALFGMLAALLFSSKKLMEILPNIHLIGVFIVAITAVYGAKALLPIYGYIFLDGLFLGFNLAWIPYLYIWLPLWLAVLLLPKNMPKKIAVPVYSGVCALHGFLFGVLYAPFQAFAFGLNFKGTLAWIIAGLPYDAIHGVSNMLCGLLIVPIITVLKNAEKKIR